MTISRRLLLAGAGTLVPSAAISCVVDGPPLPKHPTVKAVASRLAEIERATRELREMLPNIPEIGSAAAKGDTDSMSGWYAKELERSSTELTGNAQALHAIIADFLASKRI